MNIFLYFIIFLYSWMFGLFSYVNYNYVRLLSYFYFLSYFLICLFILLTLNKSILWYHLVHKFYTLTYFYISYVIGVDGMSISFILLSSFIVAFCFLIYWYLNYLSTFYSFILFFTLWVLVNVFSSIDLFLFYIFFEGVVIPMFFLIGVWGSRKRKIYASYQFFLYTLFGSVFVLLVILNVYYNKGVSSFDYMLNMYYSEGKQVMLIMFLFLGFGVKVPIMPLHIWLPEAHVEAPTPGSVILASILLKLGTYAMLRLLVVFIPVAPSGLVFFFLILALFGFTYASLTAMNQIDIKKIIAYSSVAHMNFSLLGLFSESLIGLAGLFFLMFGHAITSGALFMSIGALYDRYKTRLIFYFGSLVTFMPLFGLLLFLQVLSNFGFPGTFNFVGEFLILIGAFDYSNFAVMLATFGMILTLIYSLSFYSKIFFGKFQIFFIRYYSECSRLEFFCLSVFCALILFFGLFPGYLFNLNMWLYKF